MPRIKKEQLIHGLTVAECNQLISVIDNLKSEITSMYKIYEPSKPYIDINKNSSIEEMEKAIEKKKAYEEELNKYNEKVQSSKELLPQKIKQYGETFIIVNGVLENTSFPIEKAINIFNAVFENVYNQDHDFVPEEKLEKYSWLNDINDKRKEYYNDRFVRFEDAFLNMIDIVK